MGLWDCSLRLQQMSFYRKNQEAEEQFYRSERSATLNNSVSSFASVEGGERRLLTQQNLTVTQIKLIGKEKYKKQPDCTVCDNHFTATNRQHHCRVCSNAVCSKCSSGTINKERACDVCYLKWSDPNREERKEKLISCLETLCTNMNALKEQKGIVLIELRKQRINPSEYIRVDQAELKKYEEEAATIKAQKEEVDHRLDALRRRSEEMAMKIREYDEELAS